MPHRILPNCGQEAFVDQSLWQSARRLRAGAFASINEFAPWPVLGGNGKSALRSSHCGEGTGLRSRLVCGKPSQGCEGKANQEKGISNENPGNRVLFVGWIGTVVDFVRRLIGANEWHSVIRGTEIPFCVVPPDLITLLVAVEVDSRKD